MPELYPMRINKYLALKGHATRRGADELIEAGKVTINGQLAVLGDKVSEDDEVRVMGTSKGSGQRVYYAYNKPKGVVTSLPQGMEKDILGSIDLKDVFPLGRLDKESHGLILLTSDGRITDRLLNPKYAHEKEYVVTTKEKLRSSFKDKMEAGVDIGGPITAPAKVKILGEKKFSIIISEGKRHQIRRMCDALFAEVADLERIRIMNIKLGSLAPNSYRKIEGEELKNFLKALGL